VEACTTEKLRLLESRIVGHGPERFKRIRRQIEVNGLGHLARYHEKVFFGSSRGQPDDPRVGEHPLIRSFNPAGYRQDATNEQRDFSAGRSEGRNRPGGMCTPFDEEARPPARERRFKQAAARILRLSVSEYDEWEDMRGSWVNAGHR